MLSLEPVIVIMVRTTLLGNVYLLVVSLAAYKGVVWALRIYPLLKFEILSISLLVVDLDTTIIAAIIHILQSFFCFQ